MNRNEVSWSVVQPSQMLGRTNLYPGEAKNNLSLRIAEHLRLKPENILITAGGDQLIEIFLLNCLVQGVTTVAIQNPSFSLFKERALLLGLEIIELELDSSFGVDLNEWLLKLSRAQALILCSPNNPTGNCLNSSEIEILFNRFQGKILLDQAYLEFCQEPKQNDFSDLALQKNGSVVLRTFSKAWGLAALRVGYAIGTTETLEQLRPFLTPYNVSQWSLEAAIAALENSDAIELNLQKIRIQIGEISRRLASWSSVAKVFPSETNFILVELFDFHAFEKKLGIYRDRIRRLPPPMGLTMIRLTIDLEIEVEVE